MKRFFFSLEKLLSLREFREKEAELALGKAISARDSIKLQLEEIAQKRVTASSERKITASIQDLVSVEHYIARLDIQKEKLLEEIVKAELVVEKMRGKYLEATRDRQVISKLKEKKQAVWYKDMLEDEASVLDDMFRRHEDFSR
jgi:flagellar FliJ protein